jgi:hypothetical protein
MFLSRPRPILLLPRQAYCVPAAIFASAATLRPISPFDRLRFMLLNSFAISAAHAARRAALLHAIFFFAAIAAAISMPLSPPLIQLARFLIRFHAAIATSLLMMPLSRFSPPARPPKLFAFASAAFRC